MIYFVNDTRQITEELTLKDFHWQLKSATYYWDGSYARIEMEVWENLNVIKVRGFEFPCTVLVSPQDCIDAILALPAFANSTLVE